MQMSYAVLLLLSKVTQRHFRHSASKVHCALPRAQHGICSSIPCWCSLILSRTQRIARARNTLFMWTISSLARIFPYATSIEFLVATASATSFHSSAVMYLWGQLLRIRMVICMCRANTPSIGRQWKRKKYKHCSKKLTFFLFVPLSSRQRECPERAIILKKHLSPQLSGDENERKSSHPLIFNCELFCKKTNKFVKINYPLDS